MTTQTPMATDALTSFKINDVHSLGVFADDLATDSLEQAHALTIALGALLDLAEPNTDNPPIRATHLSKALEGICALMALSAFAREAASKES